MAGVVSSLYRHLAGRTKGSKHIGSLRNPSFGGVVLVIAFCGQSFIGVGDLSLPVGSYPQSQLNLARSVPLKLVRS